MKEPRTNSEGAAARPRMRGRRMLQLAAFLAGLALLAWCITLAFRPENRESVKKLLDADPGVVAGLFAVSLASIALNGTVFWLTIRPVRSVPFASAQAVNVLATFLNYLPFKIGLASRFVLHKRRDGVPLLTTAAWMAAAGVVALLTLLPPLGASLLFERVDARWAAFTFGICILGMSAVCLLARGLAGEKGLARITAVTDTIRFGPLSRLVRTGFFQRLHAAADMLANPITAFGTLGLRLIDLGAQSARFWLAAKATGQELSFSGAVLLASIHFLIGVLSPGGALGLREGGVTGAASLLAGAGVGTGGFAVVALTVSAAELLCNTAGAGAALAYLRPWKRTNEAQEPPSGSATTLDHAPGSRADQPDHR